MPPQLGNTLARCPSPPAEACLAEVEVVPAEPAATFAERCCASAAAAAAAGRRYDAIYLSQITYLTQQCLLPSVPDLVRRLRAVVGPEVLLIVDGYHGFCAVPTDLGQVAGECCYVAGMLKHAGCGANCAFMTLPARLDLKPVLTGWLADPSVLAPGSGGIQIGSEVRRLRRRSLAGSNMFSSTFFLLHVPDCLSRLLPAGGLLP